MAPHPAADPRALCLAVLLGTLAASPALAGEERPWRRAVQRCADVLIDRGTDRYGPVHTPMLMSIIDTKTLESPEKPLLLDGEVFDEGRPQRRNPGGSNLWYDQATLRVLYKISKLTGEEKYARAADAYIRAVFQRAVKDNGLLVWGSHIFYDAYKDAAGGDGDGKGPHEILVYHPEWAELFRLEPEGTRREIEGIWQWHVADKSTGQHNRHDDRQPGCDFAFSGGSFVLAFSFLYGQTKDPKHLEHAWTMADWHARHRDPRTGLVPDAPSTGDRYDARHCFTTVSGPHAAQLLRAYELSGDNRLLDLAIGYIKAYDRWGYDPKAGTYWAMLRLDGTPVVEAPRGEGYDAWAPTGHVDIWKTSIYSYEFPLVAAQSAVYAYEVSGRRGKADPDLLAIALRWAGAIEGALPPKPGRRWKAELEAALPDLKRTGGSYAEDYGRTISFFIHLFHATGDRRHLATAEGVAREAMEKLQENGLFKGHPAKPYYEATNGVGILLHAFLELDLLPEQWQGAF